MNRSPDIDSDARSNSPDRCTVASVHRTESVRIEVHTSSCQSVIGFTSAATAGNRGVVYKTKVPPNRKHLAAHPLECHTRLRGRLKASKSRMPDARRVGARGVVCPLQDSRSAQRFERCSLPRKTTSLLTQIPVMGQDPGHGFDVSIDISYTTLVSSTGVTMKRTRMLSKPSRREVFQVGGIGVAAGLMGGAQRPAQAAGGTQSTNVYARIGVRPFINLKRHTPSTGGF
jgi:hypothetical protein